MSPPAPVHPQGLTLTQASPSLLWALTPAALWPPSFWFLTSNLFCTHPGAAPVPPEHSPPMAPQRTWEKSQDLKPDIQGPVCSAPHLPLQLHISLLPQNHIPLQR